MIGMQHQVKRPDLAVIADVALVVLLLVHHGLARETPPLVSQPPNPSI
jgi:hypothetical protein